MIIYRYHDRDDCVGIVLILGNEQCPMRNKKKPLMSTIFLSSPVFDGGGGASYDRGMDARLSGLDAHSLEFGRSLKAAQNLRSEHRPAIEGALPSATAVCLMNLELQFGNDQLAGFGGWVGGEGHDT